MAVITELNRKRCDDTTETNAKAEKATRKGKAKQKKAKKDWVAIVHRGCRVAIFRIIEVVLLFITLSIICLLIGSSGIPLLAYEMSSGFGLTQTTNIYIAIASWILPMLFYTLLITAASFCILKRYIKWIHTKFTNIINKPEVTEEKSK